MSPQELVQDLAYCFLHFDSIIESHGLEKLKTIGDGYMCAGGLPEVNQSHPTDIVKAALDIIQFMNEEKERRNMKNQSFWDIRIGIHTGPLIAGVIGDRKFSYDVWGDTVNTASRLESTAEIGRINISQATYDLVKEKFVCEPRGLLPAKNKNDLEMYFVNREKSRP